MANNKQATYFETGLYITLFAIALLIPFLASNRFEERNWNFVFRGWLHLVPFLVVFVINNYFLAPKLLLKGKNWQYIFACTGLIAIVILTDYALLSKGRMDLRLHEGRKEMPMEHFLRPKDPPVFKSPDFNPDFSPDKMKHQPFFRPPFFNFGAIIIYFLIIGFNSGLKIFVRWNEELNRQAEKEKHHLSTELAFLKYQISPHFFMNTLNNIHALVDVDAEGSKEAIIKLSRLMRYLLYESDVEKTSLKKEIEFLESYIELMRLRYNEESLDICLKYPDDTEKIVVPSFLFLSFVENAFKHGVHPNDKSQIDIVFKTQKNQLTMDIRNRIFSDSIVPEMKEGTGIGLENVGKRLQLIYKDNYTLTVKENDNWYEVSLTIPVL